VAILKLDKLILAEVAEDDGRGTTRKISL